MIVACTNCKYFAPGARSPRKEGTCRRTSPTQLIEELESQELDATDEGGNVVMTLQTVTNYTGWPDVMTSDWCGEFESRAGFDQFESQ